MNTLDITLFRALNGLAGKWALLDWIGLGLTAVGSAGALWAVLALAFFFTGDRRRGGARQRALGVLLLGTLAASGVIEAVLKRLVGRPRPPVALAGVHLLSAVPRDFSFPSGHALSSFAAATLLLLGLRGLSRNGRGLGLAGIGLAVLIALSRVFLGHHYPSDILVGAVLGTALGWGVWAVAERALYPERPFSSRI